MLDYNVYHFTKKELVYEIVRAGIIVSFAGILFFENIIGVLMLLPFAFFLVKDRKKKKREERLFNLRNDFKEFLASFSSSVQAGYTMEQSIMIGLEDLKRMYPEDERAMIRELSWMYQQLKLQISCDELFSNLAERTGLEEIRSFSVILGIGRKQGGNLVQITRRTAMHMNRKIQVEMEMEQAVAGRRMEKNIMFVMPFFIILYLRITNTDYMDILFSSMTGHLIMLACLILLWIGNKWAERIVNINF